MALNNPVPASAGRQPRAAITVNGQKIGGLVSFEVNNNTQYQADTFHVVLSLSNQPAATNWAWWSDQTKLALIIYAGFPADPNNFTTSELKTLIGGGVDQIEIDPVADEIHLSGRDLTSVFLDAKTTETLVNQTASQIAQTLAARHGLQAQVTPTKTKAGKYYEIDFRALTERRSEWDWLTYLAEREQFNVFVQGTTLYFQPPPDPGSNPFVLQWQAPTSGGSPTANAVDLKMERALTIAKGVYVTVRSWNLKQNKLILVTYPKPANGQQLQTIDAQKYSYTLANLDTQQALLWAQAKYHEIIRHERRIVAVLPVDDALTTQVMVQLTGTGTSFDQTYFPSAIVRRMSMSEGYMMALHAKNHSPNTTV